MNEHMGNAVVPNTYAKSHVGIHCGNLYREQMKERIFFFFFAVISFYL